MRQRLPLGRRIPGRGTGETQQALQIGGIQPRQLSQGKTHLLRRHQHLVALTRLRRPGGAQRQRPVAAHGKVLAAGSQLQAGHPARPGHGERQRQPALLAILEVEGLGQFAAGLQATTQGPGQRQALILTAHVAQLHQGAGLISPGAEARPAYLGHQGRHHLDGALRLADLLLVPGQRHQRQLTVEVRQIQRDARLARLIEAHLATPERGDLDPALQRPAFLEGRRIATVAEASQLAVLRRDHLTVVIEQILGEALAPEEDLERIEGLVIADVEHPPIHRRQHHPALAVRRRGHRHLEPGERHRLVRRTQGERQATGLSIQH
ncbi:hypothetical protein D3C79_345310 [compost metagenome]